MALPDQPKTDPRLPCPAREQRGNEPNRRRAAALLADSARRCSAGYFDHFKCGPGRLTGPTHRDRITVNTRRAKYSQYTLRLRAGGSSPPEGLGPVRVFAAATVNSESSELSQN